jgi:hypothetical protein
MPVPTCLRIIGHDLLLLGKRIVHTKLFMNYGMIGLFFKFGLPVIAASICFVLTKRMHSRGLRLSIRIASSFILVLGIPLLLGSIFIELSCSKTSLPIISPDGKYLAFSKLIAQGALGDDYATVRVRRSWIPFSTIVYTGLGFWDFKQNKQSSPEVMWINNTTLLIRYYDDRKSHEGRGATSCKNTFEGIQIKCVNKLE